MRAALLLALALPLLAACATGDGPPPAPGVAPFAMGTPDVVLLVTGATDGLPASLALRAGLVRRYRSAFPRTVLLDTGDAFRGGAPHDARHRLVVRALREIGYDAAVLGPHEWTPPLRSLRAWLSTGDVAWLSTTVAPQEGPPLPLAREVKRAWGERRLALVSDLRRDDETGLARRKLDALAFAPPERLRERVAALKTDGYAVVAVAAGGPERAEATARACAADLVLPGRVPAGDAAAVGQPGEFVGVYALRLRGAAVAAVEYRREAVDARWPADEGLRAVAGAYADAPGPPARGAAPATLPFVASSACADCHRIEHDAWRERGHARAFATVTESGRAADATCRGCHVTGGATALEPAGVHCQSCHRFALDEHGGGGFSGYPPDERLCRECHTEAVDPDFDYETHRARVGCVAR